MQDPITSKVVGDGTFRQTTRPTDCHAATRSFLAAFAFTFVPLAAAVLVVWWFIHANDIASARRILEHNSERQLIQVEHAIKMRLVEGKKDVPTLASHNEVVRILDDHTETNRDSLEREFAGFMWNHPEYDHVSLLDREGRSLVSLQRTVDAVNVSKTPETDFLLRNVRAYIPQVLALSRGEAVAWPLARGATSEIYRPKHRIALLFASPALDSLGKQRGAILTRIADVELVRALDMLQRETSNVLFLTDERGFWVRDPDLEILRATNAVSEPPSRSLGGLDAEAWQHIAETDSGQVETPTGLFRFATMAISDVRMTEVNDGRRARAGAEEYAEGQRTWKVVFLTPAAGLTAAALAPIGFSDWVATALLVVFAVGSAVEAKLRIDRQRANDECRRTYWELKQVLESMASIVIVVRGADLQVVEWNPMAEKVLGLKRTQVFKRSLAECSVEWDFTVLGPALERCADEHVVIRLDDLTFKRPAGEAGILGMTLSPTPLGASGAICIVLVARDLTDQLAIDRSLSQSQKLEAIGQLAAGIAHEINTPIQFVGDNLQFLEESFKNLFLLLGEYQKLRGSVEAGDTSTELVRNVTEAEQEADVEFLAEDIPRAIAQSREGAGRVAHIVRAMKTFSHPGSTAKELVDLNKAIESTATVSRNEWKYAADLVTEFGSDLPLVPCWAADINQVILNVIVNAAHAIQERFGESPVERGTITVRTQKLESCVEVSIEDTGGGIPEEIRSRIFDPFFTTKEVGRGTGQGLAMAQSIVVRKHGGSLDFDSELGKGTTFRIRLPLQS